MDNSQLDVNVMLDSLSARIAQLEKEKAVLLAQVSQLRKLAEGGPENG